MIHKLLPHAVAGMEIDRFELVASDQITGVPHRPGTYEYLFCERGEITLRVEGQTLKLQAGDVAAFAGDQRHSYASEEKRGAVGFSVVTLARIPIDP